MPGRLCAVVEIAESPRDDGESGDGWGTPGAAGGDFVSVAEGLVQMGKDIERG